MIEINKLYYFDGYHSGSHLYNAVLILIDNKNKYETISYNLDILGRTQFVKHTFGDPRLGAGVSNWLFKVEELSIDEKKLLVDQILSFKIVGGPK